MLIEITAVGPYTTRTKVTFDSNHTFTDHTTTMFTGAGWIVLTTITETNGPITTAYTEELMLNLFGDIISRDIVAPMTVTIDPIKQAERVNRALSRLFMTASLVFADIAQQEQMARVSTQEPAMATIDQIWRDRWVTSTENNV